MTGSLFYAFMMSLLIGTVLTPCLIMGSTWLRLFDQPGHRKIHKEPIARVGGIAFAVGALVSIWYWTPQSDLTTGIFAASLIILVMGSLDDFFDLRVRSKFAGQFLAAGIVAIYGHLSWQPFTMLFGLTLPPWLAIPLTMIMLVAMTNAMNLSDGLDGLAGGISFLNFGLISYLAFQMDAPFVLFLTIPVMGGLLGFLRFNSFPARVFMGDGGSQFLGFLLGATALTLTQAEVSPLSPLLVLFFIGLPLLDLVAVMIQRLLTGRGPFQPDKEHLHHKLLRVGFTHHQTVLLLYIFQIGIIVLAYFCRWSSDLFLGGLYLLLFAGVGTLYYQVYFRRLSVDSVQKWSTGPLYWRSWLQSKRWLSEGSFYGLAVGVTGFFLLGLLLPSTLPEQGIYLLMGLSVFVLGGSFWNAQTRLLTTRMGLYLGSIFVLYGVEHALVGATLWLQLLFQGFFGLLVIGVILAIHLDPEKRFTPNPMDYLLLFLALVLPVIFNTQWGMVQVGEMLAKLIILFFVCEVLLQAFSTKLRHVSYVSGGVLLTMAVQVLW